MSVHSSFQAAGGSCQNGVTVLELPTSIVKAEMLAEYFSRGLEFLEAPKGYLEDY